MTGLHTFREWIWREIRISVPLCLGVAIFVSAMTGKRFDHTLVYSFCIGVSIQFLIEGGRYALARRLHQRDPDNLPAQANWPGWGYMGPWIVVSGLVGYYGGSSLADALTGVRHTDDLLSGSPRTLFLMMLVTFVVSVGVTYVFYLRGRMATIEAHAQAARRTAIESRLKLLESQLEPHMLFNTLANLRVLIGVDPPRAQAMLDHLISFLRATLGASRASLHPLSAEFARLADYLDLMKVRMGERLEPQFDLPDELRDWPVPPLLLQPLVENAIKHGLEPHVEGGRLIVSATRDSDRLLLRVRDTGAGLRETAPDGTHFGLQQVSERLAALYGSAATLELTAADDAEGGTLAIVRIPLSPT